MRARTEPIRTQGFKSVSLGTRRHFFVLQSLSTVCDIESYKPLNIRMRMSVARAHYIEVVQEACIKVGLHYKLETVVHLRVKNIW